ncbi:MAG: hypothetical protein U1F06_05355 [Steroidobacteraceae bacterium]
MKYRHAFHAGNFADVHKHVTLLALLRALQRKDKGLFYLETHAGAGLYASGGGDGHHGAEARGGLERLLPRTGAAAAAAAQPAPAAPEVHYLEAVRALRACRRRRPAGLAAARGAAPAAAGPRPCAARSSRPSAARSARAAPPPTRACARTAATATPPSPRSLPPRERRAADRPAVRGAASRSWTRRWTRPPPRLRRLANAMITLWYPIKDERELAACSAPRH